MARQRVYSTYSNFQTVARVGSVGQRVGFQSLRPMTPVRSLAMALFLQVCKSFIFSIIFIFSFIFNISIQF